MKKNFIFSLLLLFAVSGIFAQTDGTLTVTATTSSAGGNYAPKNIVAVWIEDEQGNFVKTLMAYAANRKTHLNTWEASTTAAGSPFNTVDAITGATKTSHGTRTCTWNAKDVGGTLVADGTYKVWMELTDKNGTGNYSSFTFTKDTNPVNLTPSNVPSFASISISWVPLLTGVEDYIKSDDYKIFPNPTTGVIVVTGDNIRTVEIRNLAGALVYSGNSLAIDISGRPEGIYLVLIKTDRGTVSRKILKKG